MKDTDHLSKILNKFGWHVPDFLKLLLCGKLVCVCVCVCVCACVRACVHVCVRACVCVYPRLLIISGVM